MKRLLLFLTVLALTALTYSIDYSLATDYCFVHKKDRVFIDSYFTANASANIDKHGFKGSNLYYSEEAGAIFIGRLLPRKILDFSSVFCLLKIFSYLTDHAFDFRKPNSIKNSAPKPPQFSINLSYRFIHHDIH